MITSDFELLVESATFQALVLGHVISFFNSVYYFFWVTCNVIHVFLGVFKLGVLYFGFWIFQEKEDWINSVGRSIVRNSKSVTEEEVLDYDSTAKN